MTEREREVLVTLVQLIDNRNHEPENYDVCHFTPGIDTCADYCAACAVLRDVSDDVLREARAQTKVAW